MNRPPILIAPLAAVATFAMFAMFATFTIVEPCGAEQVIFTEVHYHPAGDKPEFIEVTNNTVTPFDIALWKMSAGVDFVFPDFDEANPQAAFLQAFETILLTNVDERAFRVAYPGTPAEVRIFGPWDGQLSNGGERITLEDKNGVARASLRFDDEGKWPVAADGAGHTLTVVNPNRVNDDYRNWRLSQVPDGTPGVAPRDSDGPAAPEETYVEMAATWKYDDSNTDLGTAWTELDFDDSGWQSGPALFGFESSELPEPGLQTPFARDTQGGLVTYYLRKEFDFSLSAEGSTITIDHILDDGAVFYINGVEIGRTGMAAGAVTHTTAASEGVSNAVLSSEALRADGSRALLPGRNVLAVSVHNETPGSSDVVFGASLRIAARPEAAGGGTVVINEVPFDDEGAVTWVEVRNAGDTPVNLASLALASQLDFSDRVALTGSLAPGNLRSFAVAFGSGSGGELPVFLLAGKTVKDARRFLVPARAGAYQAAGDGEFYFGQSSTRDAENSPVIPDAVVINEIMYDTPSDHRSAEFIELFNRGAVAVDLSGWQFSEGVQFEFPSGTQLAPGAYAVVAADAAWFRNAYPGVPVAGEFEGQLSDSGELLRLEDAQGNLADEIHYMPEGDWPHLADGDGSSMELKHPDMDNSLASAWADSDESEKGPVQHFTITGEYVRTAATGEDELHFHLVGDAYAILENITVRKNGEPANLIENVDKESLSTRSADGWVSQGTHWASFVRDGQLHLISDGHGDNKSNRTEIDLERIAFGDEVTIEFDGRWVHGKPRLICQTFNHAVGLPVLLPVPENLGTPGAANSRALPAPAPVLAALLHSPPVPRSGEAVTITAEVRSAANLSAVEAVYRLDNRDGNGGWQRLAMANDRADTYSATIPDYRGDGDLIQFYVEARTAAGQVTRLPKHGAERPAMWIVDDADNESDLLLQRFILSAYDLDALGNAGAGSKFQSKFPRMSNHYFNMTFIANEKEIYYNGEIRKSGSPFTRDSGNSLTHGKWKLPGDRLFRGRRKSVIDPTTDYNDRIARFFLYQMGHPINENEWVQVMINDGRPAIREDMEPIATDFISRNFEDGNNGTLLRIDDEWFFGDGGSGGSRNADWSYKDSDNPIRYQSEWIMRSQETRYDYTSFIEWVRTLDDSRNLDIKQLDRLMDRDLACINAAVRGYDGDWDTLTLNRGKNGYFYRKPDGLWMLVHWDGDRTFENANETILGGLAGVRTYFQFEPVRRTMNYWLTELLTKYTKDSPRTLAWFDAEEESTPSHRAGASKYTRWFTSREPVAKRFVGNGFDTAFAITDGDAATAAATTTLSGTAPTSVYEVRIENHPEAVVEWTGLDEWTATGIRLSMGANALKALGVGHGGDVRADAGFTVTKTGDGTPVPSLALSPRSGRLGVDEVLVLDASASYDPEGGTLAFEWTTPDGLASFLADGAGATAQATFTAPGSYTFAVKVNDAAGGSATLQQQVSVYGEGGFSPFNATLLEQQWTPENTTQPGNSSPSGWYSLTEKPGYLTIQVLDDKARPLGLAAPELPEPAMVFDVDAAWRFDDSNTDRGREWLAPGFDDSAWQSGPGLFGFESSELGHPLQSAFRRDSAGGLVTYYLRKEFLFDGNPIGSVVTIDHYLDDGVVYYLNGTEIGRVGMPEGPITHATTAATGVSNAELTAGAIVAPGTGVLVEGTNILAAELHNESPGSSDAVLGTRLHIAALPKGNGGGSLDDTTHPWIHRALPAAENWFMETKLSLQTLQQGDFLAGLQVETRQNGGTTRYAVGYNGSAIGAYRIGADLGAIELSKRSFNASSTVEVRIAREGSEIAFLWNDTDAWSEIVRVPLAAGAIALKGGPFVATESALSVRVGFDYVMLAAPGSPRSPLAGQLMLSEIMYHPTGDPEPEYLEFFNAHNAPIALAGVTIRGGSPFDEYTFGDVTLQPGAYALLVENRAVFEARYGAVAGMIGEWSGGRLSNSGEQVAIVDADGGVIMAFEYNDRAPWPEEADGSGASLVLIAPESSPDHGNPQNWRASSIGGTPGRGDNVITETLAEWMTRNGFDDPLADPDGDGLSHLLSYAFGVDLSRNIASAVPTAVLTGVPRAVEFRFQKRSGSDVTFTIEVSADLESWETGAPLNEVVTENGDGTSSVAIQLDMSAPNYVRLNVSAGG